MAGVDIAQTSNVEELFTSMRRAFASQQHPVAHRAAFHACLQRRGESAEEYLWRLKELVPLAFDGAPPEAMKLYIVHQFEEGLLVDEVREKVIESSPKTPEEALQVARMKESFLKLRRS